MKTDSCVIQETDSVIKLFCIEAQYHRELAVYSSQAPHIPQLLDYGEVADSKDHIPGYNWFIRCRRINALPYLDFQNGFHPDLMGTAIARFHQHSFDGNQALCHIDNQPRNILFDGSGYWLVDFSDSRFEVPEYDLTHLFLFWVEEFPTPLMQNYVLSFLADYTELIQPRAQEWQASLAINIKRFAERRNRFNRQARKRPEPELDSGREWLNNSRQIHNYLLAKTTDVFTMA